MTITLQLERGAVIKSSQFEWKDSGPNKLAIPVSEEKGAKFVKGLVVQIPPGETWAGCEKGTAAEVVVVVFKGRGEAQVGKEKQEVAHASALYSPAGVGYSVHAAFGEPVTLYIWQSELPAGSKTSKHPRLFNHLYNTETQFIAYQGNKPNPGEEPSNPANMNFLFWPGTGSARLSLHCGIQEPGQSFSIHNHPISTELFIGVEGKGQVHLDGEWFDFEAGDILYSPEGLFHGTRNPHTGEGAKRFVTCGGPTPFDVNFYNLAGVSPELID